MRKIERLRKMRIATLGLLSLFAVQRVSAQDSLRVTLSQAIDIALSDNPTVKVADNEITLKKFSKTETQTGLFPTVDLTGSHSYAIKLAKINIGGQTIEMGSKHTTAVSLNASLPLIAPQLWKTIQLNSQDVDLAVEQSRQSKIDMINQVKTAYYSYLLAKDAYKTLLAGYQNAELNAKIVTDKYQQGVVSEYEKLVADVQLRNQKPQVVNGENALRLSTMQLKVLMGVDVNSPIIFEGDLNSYENEMYADLMSLKNDTSLVNNTSLRQLDINEKMLIDSEKINKYGYLPTLAATFSAGYQAMAPDLKFSDYTWYPSSTLGLSLSIPIFDGGKKYFTTKQNRVSRINLDLQRANIRRQLQLSVTNSINNIESAIEQVGSNKESVDQAEKAYNISQKRYNIGSGTLLELNTQETALTQARLQYAQSIYDFLAAKSELEATLGKTK